MDFAHGAIQWQSADAASATYTVSGLSFQPSALKFYCYGLGSATDADSATTHMRRVIGFATSATSRLSIGSYSGDNSANAAASGSYRDDCVLSVNDHNGTPLGQLDIDSITSDGFVLINDNPPPANLAVFWEAWGGSDITVAQVGTITEPAATGVQTYSVTGFTAGATDQVVMLAGNQVTNAVNTDQAGADSGFFVGYATGTDAANNVVVLGNSDHGNGTMKTEGYCKTGECLAMIAFGGGNPNARAQLTQFNTDNFGLNWIARGLTDRKSIFLAIKGGQWSAGNVTIDGGTVNATATVSGLPFTPIGLSVISAARAEDTAGVSSGFDAMSLGVGTSTTDRRSMGGQDENGTLTSEIDLTIQYDQIMCMTSVAGALNRAFDIDAMNSDGFRLIVDVAAGEASQWCGYLTFGSAAGGSVASTGLLLTGCGS